MILAILFWIPLAHEGIIEGSRSMIYVQSLQKSYIHKHPDIAMHPDRTTNRPADTHTKVAGPIRIPNDDYAMTMN